MTRCLWPVGSRQPAVLPACIALVALLVVTWLPSGCVTAPAYKSLYVVGHATDGAVRAYFDGVAAGKLSTNHVPRVSRLYNRFQAAYSRALEAAERNPQAPAEAEVQRLGADVAAAVDTARKERR